MIQTTYRVIGFGSTEHGFFNEPSFCSTIDRARSIFNAHMNNAEMTGSVLIRVNHEDWQVIDEFGTVNVSVVYGPLGGFHVKPSPNLVMV